METGNCSYPAASIFDELPPWMPVPPAYYPYHMPTNGQVGSYGHAYPMAMQHPLPYPNMANWYGYNTCVQSNGKYKKKRNLFTKLQLNMLQRRFAEKEHIRQPERDNFAQMIGLTGEQVKIWFQNQRYKRKHRGNGQQNASVTGSSGANTSVSSLSSPSPADSPDSKFNITREVRMVNQTDATGAGPDLNFHNTQNCSQLYWGPQMAYYPTPPFQHTHYSTVTEEKLSLSSSSENDLES